MADPIALAEKADAVLEALLAGARAAGAEEADAVAISTRSLEMGCRLGAPEHAERSESSQFGLRVLLGGRQAAVATADTRAEALEATAERAVAMAKAAPADPYAGLAEAAERARDFDAEALEICDSAEPTESELADLARAAEDAARAVAGVTNSAGAGAGATHSEVALATSDGFFGRYRGSEFSLGVSVLAGEGGAMERDYASSTTRFFAALEAPESVGRRAGERAVARLDPVRPETGRMPILFHPRAANSLLGHFAQGIDGAAIARGTSFLKDRMGAAVFAPGIRILDDPLRRRGLRSRPFDAEGVAARRLTLVEDGRLESWLLDSANARKLGLKTTGSAVRGLSSAPYPGPTNLFMEPGVITPGELLESVGHGVYVTELIGMGVNPVTGDYSRGAAGFLIEGGEITRPVSEFTIAGNLEDMFARLTPASDLVFRYPVNAPTLAVEGMTVAGT